MLGQNLLALFWLGVSVHHKSGSSQSQLVSCCAHFLGMLSQANTRQSLNRSGIDLLHATGLSSAVLFGAVLSEMPPFPTVASHCITVLRKSDMVRESHLAHCVRLGMSTNLHWTTLELSELEACLASQNDWRKHKTDGSLPVVETHFGQILRGVVRQLGLTVGSSMKRELSRMPELTGYQQKTLQEWMLCWYVKVNVDQEDCLIWTMVAMKV